MKGSISSRHAIIVGVAIALLAGCGGAQPPISAPGATTDSGNALAHRKRFDFTSAKQIFTVPSGVTHITINAYGAAGSFSAFYYSSYIPVGGRGGMVTATIPVTPRERLAIFVGGGGLRGGFNGGGSSFAESRARHVKITEHANNRNNGRIVITW